RNCRAVETALSRSDKRKGEKGAAPLGGTLLMGKGIWKWKRGAGVRPSFVFRHHPHVCGWEMGNGFNPCFRSDYCSAAGEWESGGFRRHLPRDCRVRVGAGAGVGAGVAAAVGCFSLYPCPVSQTPSVVRTRSISAGSGSRRGF